MSAELACTYAALILNDDGIDITGDKIATILKVSEFLIKKVFHNSKPILPSFKGATKKLKKYPKFVYADFVQDCRGISKI